MQAPKKQKILTTINSIVKPCAPIHNIPEFQASRRGSTHRAHRDQTDGDHGFSGAIIGLDYPMTTDTIVPPGSAHPQAGTGYLASNCAIGSCYLPEPHYPVSFHTLQPGVPVVLITLAFAPGHEVLPGVQPAHSKLKDRKNLFLKRHRSLDDLRSRPFPDRNRNVENFAYSA